MTTVVGSLDLLRSALAEHGGPRPLDMAGYARAHATYEAHSDQRALLTESLAATLDALLPGPAPRTVLSIGPGDGSVDAPLATGLAPGRGPVRWIAAEPAAVGTRAQERVGAALAGSGGSAVLHPGTFQTLGETVGDDVADVVLAVHSLYYVPDLGEALTAARRRLAPGGALLVALAPLEDLCLLTTTVDAASHRWWSADLLAALPEAGLTAQVTRVAGRLDVTDCSDPTSADGADVLDFLVGADCSDLAVPARAALLDALDAITTTEGDRRYAPHPVDVVVAVAQSS
ncbi:class I SAM-dependent methyltransferase [Geodermatophilaceae bacterium NBWT11]|nr:class I SAM-dependent methyltransferase [Geodermatophilaceae bacterium NBWT11]